MDYSRSCHLVNIKLSKFTYIKKKTAGQLIKEARIKAGLSQRELADMLGYKTVQYISDWERDKFRVPIDKIKSLAIKIGLKPNVLLTSCYPEIKEIL